MRRGILLFATVALILAACSSGPHVLSGFVREPTPNVAGVSLPDVSRGGDDFAFEAEDGNLLLVYFGYTSCPDVCPTTLADVRKALGELGSNADRVDLAMATVDPMRDTDRVITGYVQSFVRDAHSLRTEDDAALKAAADSFGATYAVSVNEEGTIEVIHSGALYAVNDDGALLVTWPFGTEWEDLAADLEHLLRSA